MCVMEGRLVADGVGRCYLPRDCLHAGASFVLASIGQSLTAQAGARAFLGASQDVATADNVYG